MDLRLATTITLSFAGLVWTGFLPGQPTTHDPLDMIDTLVKMTVSIETSGLLNFTDTPVDRNLLSCALKTLEEDYVQPCLLSTDGSTNSDADIEKCFLNKLLPAPNAPAVVNLRGLHAMVYGTSLSDDQMTAVIEELFICWGVPAEVPPSFVESIIADQDVTKTVVRTFVHTMMNGDSTIEFLSLRQDLRNTKMAMCYFREMMLNDCFAMDY